MGAASWWSWRQKNLNGFPHSLSVWTKREMGSRKRRDVPNKVFADIMTGWIPKDAGWLPADNDSTNLFPDVSMEH
ncbi:hypothetical protein AA16373_1152 [Komagataeibacter swingsii DSM 16373]|nr:hypothetical protein AA16373_1152 [Komagataeibacter swingsii DSM 16373]